MFYKSSSNADRVYTGVACVVGVSGVVYESLGNCKMPTVVCGRLVVRMLFRKRCRCQCVGVDGGLVGK